jgi:excisionase family DNA binding protein
MASIYHSKGRKNHHIERYEHPVSHAEQVGQDPPEEHVKQGSILASEDGSETERGESDCMRTYQVQEVARLLGIAASTVYDLARQRKISHRRIGTGRGRIVFTELDVQEFLDSCKVEALSLPALSRFTHSQ